MLNASWQAELLVEKCVERILSEMQKTRVKLTVSQTFFIHHRFLCIEHYNNIYIYILVAYLSLLSENYDEKVD